MSKLRRDLRLAIAGACSGLFSVSMFLLGYRVVAYYEYLASRGEDVYERGYHHHVQELWWIPLVMWNVVLSVVASLLVHRYLDSGRVSTFLRWQVIGVAVLVGWGLTMATGVGMQCMIRGNTQAIGEVFDVVKLIWIGQFVAALFASNVLYGTAIQAACAEDTRTQSEVITDP